MNHLNNHVYDQSTEIFVFGSNESGVHGAGAALTAHIHYGAIFGAGNGIQGQSYAIPTKDFNIMTLPIESIKKYVDEFIEYAKSHGNLKFFVTAIGTGLAGYAHSDIAPLFVDAPDNCRLPPEWIRFNNSFVV